jgi:hypothetical protein
MIRALSRRRVGIVVIPVGICALLVAGAAWATTFYGQVIPVKGTGSLSDCGSQSTCLGVVDIGDNPVGQVVNAVTHKVTNVSGTSGLSDIDCPTKDYCIAVGTTTGFQAGAIVQIHSGVPGTADAVGYYPYAVACGSASSCWVPGARVNKKTHEGTAPVVLHLVDGKITKVIAPPAPYTRYPYLFSAGEQGGALTCLSDHCIIAGKLSDTGPGALFSLQNDHLRLLTKVNDMTAVAGLWCFSSDLCRITGYDSANRGVFATFDKGHIEQAHTFGNGLGPIGCLDADMRCFVFGHEGTYPHTKWVVVKLDANGKFADSKVIEPIISGVFCSHTCIAAGGVGQYPSGEAVFFEKFVH